jgi:hypothetical protein
MLECKLSPKVSWHYSLKNNVLSFNDSTAMNVIRMIKLFGWERKMEERIQEKREEELKVLWKREVLDLVNSIIK